MSSDCWDGYIYEHRYVVELQIGRSLRSAEVVHHLNGCRHDNRSSNLIVVSRGDHSKLHAWIDVGAPGMETLRQNGENCWKPSEGPLRVCAVCGLTIQNSKAVKYCSKVCNIKQRHLDSVKPDKDALIKDFEQLRSFVGVARKYGVSDNAVRKWCVSYDLPTKKAISSRALSKLGEGSETSGEVADAESS
jgi:hypothetical protein